MNQIISRENDQKFDDLIVEAQVHLVFVDKNGKPRKIPDEFARLNWPIGNILRACFKV